MARIRTIKPEFFTSEDIVGLSPLARLLYIALWCEADKEGRFVWKPVTFRLRYLPGDSCDVQALCKELTDSGLVVLYGDGLAYIPAFSAHQHINPRESESQLPNPDASARVGTRQPRVNSRIDPQVGREGKDIYIPPTPQGGKEFARIEVHLPPELASVADAWQEYQRYRREKPGVSVYSDTGCKKLAAMLVAESYDAERFTGLLDHCMASGWNGLPVDVIRKFKSAPKNNAPALRVMTEERLAELTA